jgi:two-component system CheB/CheR fusion protein
MVTEEGARTGTLVHCEDITPEEKLRNAVEQLEATGEDLQSANEELETANEELQSTNEELETTNEELQSTNEELETTNEELQSLNEELENMNEELEHRTRELNEHSQRYAETLRSMPFPVMLLDGEERVQLWNSAAQKLLGVGSTSVVGVAAGKLPVGNNLRNALVRRCQSVLLSQRPAVLRNQLLNEKRRETFDLHFAPVSRGETGVDGILVIFSPSRSGALPKPEKPASAARKRAPAGKNSQSKSGSKKKRR